MSVKQLPRTTQKSASRRNNVMGNNVLPNNVMRKPALPARPSMPARLRGEEPLNALTHALGGIASLIGGLALLTSQPGARVDDLVCCCLFGVTLTGTYAVSSLSHAVTAPRRKFLLRAWDQGIIYLLIVGTYTPILWKFMPLYVSGPALALLWPAAAAGFVAKVVFHHRIDDRFSAVSYVALGWLPALALCCYVPWACLQWIILGGVLYTAGVIFLKLDDRFRYFHAAWHLFVMAASACHFYAVFRFVLPPGV